MFLVLHNCELKTLDFIFYTYTKRSSLVIGNKIGNRDFIHSNL